MQNIDLNLKILNYTLNKDTLESTFSIIIDTKKQKFVYELKYPTNPIIDCYFVNLNNKSIKSVIDFINKELMISLDKSYNYKLILEKLNEFKNWLSEINSNLINLQNNQKNVNNKKDIL
tara:strand:+ start:468 stop:824 length:357 start_codon:yes stop_codon:yes gene_type:complete